MAGDVQKAVLRQDEQGRGGAAGESAISRGRLESLLGYHLRRADVAAFQSFNRHLAAERLSPAHLGVLLVIEANPGINQTRIGRTLGIDRSSLVAMVDGLEQRHLVARLPSPSDRRSHALQLTRKGESFLAALTPRLERHENEIARGLSAAERKRLITLLSRIASD
jgi:DNA-binding MarR family transcriptional regulator